MVAVVHIELVGIQRFVFGSRTLKDTIGRSSMINEFTTAGVAGVAARWPQGRVETVYAAAGRLSVVVREGRAADFVGWFTREVADTCDGLRAVVVVDSCADEAAVVESVRGAGHAVRAARHRQLPSLAGAAPWGALMCAVTGRAAEGVDQNDVPWAGDVPRAEKWGAVWHGRQQAELLTGSDSVFAGDLELPVRTDQLGRSVGETSRVAVLVADLNGVGARLRVLAGHDPDGSRVAAASAALTELGAALGQHLVATVVGALVADSSGSPVVSGFPASLSFPLHRESADGPWLLPLRPWVLAGDDLVLVCESRIVWSLACAITDWLDAPEVAADDPRAVLAGLFGARLTVGIGIAVVAVGYPLIRAHESAAVLCENAKAAARRVSEDEGVAHHGVDWYRGGVDAQTVVARRDHSTTARPYLFTSQRTSGSFAEFTRSWLGTGETSLRGPVFDDHHGWCRERLGDAAVDPRPGAVDRALRSLNRARAVAGSSAADLVSRDSGVILDAVDLLDDHLMLIQAGVRVRDEAVTP
ncbi:hypothetical protein OG225_07115 [Nocardia sp. NBC_01377]|uniref:hypothetical protein n=1 Tax=Nocardia sp. NBC_01377 TaxID=2903595 RepID=UPI00324406C4